MSIPLTRLGGHAFNHRTSVDIEAEYDRLRDLAREEARKRNDCFARSREAYASGDGAGAKALSNEGKSHAARMDDYNRQASDFIFRENNAPGRVEPDCVDLHGQFVEEAERILEDRIRAEKGRGSPHLRVIVGRGNHSVDHVQKLKPRVEQVCREMGLRYHTEENEGRIFVDLGGSGHGHAPPHHGGGGHPGARPPHHEGHGGHAPPQEEDSGLVGAIFSKLEKVCCIVM